MSAKSITATLVKPSARAILAYAVAGASIDQGQIVYVSAAGDPSLLTPPTVDLADASGAAPISTVFGMAVNSAALGQPITVVVEDPELDPGATVAEGETLYLSETTPGEMCAEADVVTTGSFKTVLSIGIGSNKMNFRPLASGIALP